MTAFSWFDPSTWPAMAPGTLNQPILPGWSVFTVNETNSSDPAAEQRIVAANSYGRQIGRMMDVVEELVKANPAVAESAAGKAFEALRKEVQAAKDDARTDRLQKLMNDLKALKTDDPKAFKALIDGVQMPSSSLSRCDGEVSATSEALVDDGGVTGVKAALGVGK